MDRATFTRPLDIKLALGYSMDMSTTQQLEAKKILKAALEALALDLTMPNDHKWIAFNALMGAKVYLGRQQRQEARVALPCAAFEIPAWPRSYNQPLVKAVA